MHLRALLRRCSWFVLALSPGVATAQTSARSVVSHPLVGEGDAARLGMIAGEMVALEWAGRGPRRVVPSTVACPDPACGARDARALGAETSLIGKIHTLGAKLTLTVYWVRSDGTVLGTAIATVQDESGLPDAARRLADDLERQPAPAPAPSPPSSPLSPPPPPPAFADDETRTDGPVLRIGYFHPISGAFPRTESLSGEVSGLFVRGLLLLEPRVGLRRSFSHNGEWFAEVPVDFAAYLRFGQGDVYPFAGGGIGVHYLMIERIESYTIGSVIYAQHRSEVDQSVLGFGGFGRAGVGFRTARRMTLFVTADAEVTRGDLFGESVHWGTALNVGFGFGG